MNDIIDMNDITQKEIISSAISRAIDECISEDILKDFLLENKEEVIEMGVLGYFPCCAGYKKNQQPL